MRICAAQIRPVTGEIDQNIAIHKQFIQFAISKQANLIFFPELSLTGYEPKLAKDLATTQADRRLNDFQDLSDGYNITIAVGLPTQGDSGILISLIIFQPHQPRQTYSKQILHADEYPYFVSGNQPCILTLENTKIAPAICYESLQPKHAEAVSKSGAKIYMASVAKSANGVNKAFQHYPKIAKKYSMTVVMANSVGACDDFESVGKSAVWNKDGLQVGQLDETTEGLLIYDTDTEELDTRSLTFLP